MKHGYHQGSSASRRNKRSAPQSSKGSGATENPNSRHNLQEEEDDVEPAVGEHHVPVQVGDREKIYEFYVKAFTHIGQSRLKQILKEMIKIVQPKKQTKNPYNGRRCRNQTQQELDLLQDDPNPGRHTAPDWWPNQDGWQEGKGCRHKEPDHLLKPGEG